MDRLLHRRVFTGAVGACAAGFRGVAGLLGRRAFGTPFAPRPSVHCTELIEIHFGFSLECAKLIFDVGACFALLSFGYRVFDIPQFLVVDELVVRGAR